ncbi:MAG: hypothetical protein AB7O43_02565, partial [Hyphomicrobiaceae bacterium]
MSFELRLIEDNLTAGSSLSLPADGINRVIYVANGAARSSAGAFTHDTAWHAWGAQSIEAGSEGAALWRWELAPAGSPAVVA